MTVACCVGEWSSGGRVGFAVVAGHVTVRGPCPAIHHLPRAGGSLMETELYEASALHTARLVADRHGLTNVRYQQKDATTLDGTENSISS